MNFIKAGKIASEGTPRVPMSHKYDVRPVLAKAESKNTPGVGEGWGRLLVRCVPMREQETAKLTLNIVFDILKLIPLFTVSSQKVTLSNTNLLISSKLCSILNL